MQAYLVLPYAISPLPVGPLSGFKGLHSTPRHGTKMRSLTERGIPRIQNTQRSTERGHNHIRPKPCRCGPDHVSASRCRLRTDSAVTTVATQIVDGLFAMARSSTTSSRAKRALLGWRSSTSSKFARGIPSSRSELGPFQPLISTSLSATDCPFFVYHTHARACTAQATRSQQAVASNTSSLTSELAAWVTARAVAGRVSTARRRSPHPRHNHRDLNAVLHGGRGDLVALP